MAGEQGTLFDERFMGRYARAIMSDPTTALVELVANAWDAYATKVEILWPDPTADSHFCILDNGKGMTPAQFEVRWRRAVTLLFCSRLLIELEHGVMAPK